MKIRSFARIVGFLIILSLVISSCGSASQTNPDDNENAGTITISGAWALYPMMIRWQEEYQKANPEISFDISAGGAGKGMADALAGAVDIGMVSRQIFPEEVEKGAFWVSVTEDAVFPTINQENPVWDELVRKGVTQDDLMKIFVSGEITTWGQLVGSTEIADPIHVFTRSDACGAGATWAEYLGVVQEDLQGVGVYGDPGLLDAVIKDPLSIGYNNLNYIFDMGTGEPLPGARVLPIDFNENHEIDDGEIYETKVMAINGVVSGKYPSPPARNLNLVMQGKPSGLVKSFITWILTEGQQFVDETGYVALPQDLLDQQLEKLN
jgi:phosphate transport system substrate-binding protein